MGFIIENGLNQKWAVRMGPEQIPKLIINVLRASIQVSSSPFGTDQQVILGQYASNRPKYVDSKPADFDPSNLGPNCNIPYQVGNWDGKQLVEGPRWDP